MVCAMILPNGLLTFKILNRDFKSSAYIDLLCETIVHMGKLNYSHSFWFQQDNSRIYVARIVKEWMTDIHFRVLSSYLVNLFQFKFIISMCNSFNKYKSFISYLFTNDKRKTLGR